ncbi:MAG: hypothetical protein PHH44_08905 [bacterium]|nr:hypothetical protein [bacterium]
MKRKVLFILGILLALTGATLMFFGVWPLPLRITIGIIGLALIATGRKS